MNIQIDNDLGTSPVGRDTMLIAKCASKLKFKTALDVGTGTGFVSIYLTTCGFHCDGSDINPMSISCAKKNAARNKFQIHFSVSDLFKNIEKRYDLIIFNPPFGNVNSSLFSKYLEILKSMLPKENKIIAGISFRLIRKQREKLIKQFLLTCTDFLTKVGLVLILLHDSELLLLNGMKFLIVDGYDNMKLILINFQSN